MAGAPVDPAIISASVARPDTKKASNKEEVSGEKAPSNENEAVASKPEAMTKQDPPDSAT